MTKRKTSKKRKNKNNMLAYLILVGLIVLLGFVLSSPLNRAESYAFCEKLNESYKSTNNYTELKDQLKNLCNGRELSKEELELGNLSVEFMESLSIFNVSWKENESIAKEYDTKTDSGYQQIMAMNVISSGIPIQVDALYKAEIGNLVSELIIQDMDIKNAISSVKQLEEKNSNLTARLESMRSEEEKKKGTLKNLSLAYSEEKNESNNLESNLSFTKSEYEKTISSFNDSLFPFLLVGIAIGGVLGFGLSLKWKKERSYWDAYSSSAVVKSPLRFAALITGSLLAILILYLFLSGIIDDILAA